MLHFVVEVSAVIVYDFPLAVATSRIRATRHAPPVALEAGVAHPLGSSVELYGLRATKGGLATVVMDGTEVGVVDFYGKVRIGNQLIWSSPALTPGEHTLTVIATGTSSEQASGVDIDRMLVRP